MKSFDEYVESTKSDKYNCGGKEVIDIIKELNLSYPMGNVVKYLFRYCSNIGNKTGNIKDLYKAGHYILFEKQMLDYLNYNVEYKFYTLEELSKILKDKNVIDFKFKLIFYSLNEYWSMVSIYNNSDEIDNCLDGVLEHIKEIIQDYIDDIN